MKIYVDADACPVKEIIIAEALKVNLPVILVKSYSHFSPQDDPPGAQSVYVDTGADSVDYRIMYLAKSKDIIITQDYGLASLALAKDCTVIHHKGFLYTNQNIDDLLHTRHAHAKARRSGQKTKGPRAMTNEDKEKFRKLFSEILN
ncbi:YaiI/YqxD family protein [Aquibacillus saliphilus]|uniref:YaiI/YqxD family protein n=1 Tax=Aquibacillus saliphilus TaxID=1909422 RepID=UPI001CF099C1|nr:YaiI/YqxD family protein [Aquibacillus saliphilus]